MIRAVLLLCRRSVLRWVVPPAAVAALLLVAERVRAADTGIVAGAEATYAALVWAPAALLAGYVGVRQTGPVEPQDPLVIVTERSDRLRRVSTAYAAPLIWVSAGWLGFWAGCTVLAYPGGITVPPVMALSGLSLGWITSVSGAMLASARAPAWGAAVCAVTAYAGLAVWFYVPDVAAAILYAANTPAFLTNALPNPAVLALQAAWAAAVVVVLAGARARFVVPRNAAATLALLAVGCTLVASATPYVLSRSGRVELSCDSRAGTRWCWWADHPGNRGTLAEGAALAQELTAGSGLVLPATITESDHGALLPHALPSEARAGAVTVPARAHLTVTTVASTAIASAVRAPSHCGSGASGPGTFSVPGRIEEVLTGRRSVTGRTLTDAEIRTWIRRLVDDVAHCRETPPP